MGTDRSGVRVLLSQGGKVRRIAVQAVNRFRVEARIPGDTPLGDANLVVETSEGASKPFPLSVVASQPGLFTINGRGWGQGKITNLDLHGHSSANAAGNPALPGQTVSVLATGLGKAHQLQMVIGGSPEPASSTKRDAAGIDEIRFRVPANSPLGCSVPVYARTPDGRRSNIVTVTIGSQRADCSEREPLFSTAGAFGRDGLIALVRAVTLHSESPTVTEDQAAAMFFRYDASASDLNLLSIFPPIGHCNAVSGDLADLEYLASLPLMLTGGVRAKELDAGNPLLLAGQQGTRRLYKSHGSAGSYWGSLGMDNPSISRAPPLFFGAAQSKIDVPGSADIDGFSRSWPGPAVLNWTNSDDFALLYRTRAATFVWREAPPDAVVIAAALGVDPITTAATFCFCTSRASAGRLTMPADMFTHFPNTTNQQVALQNVSMLMTLRLSAGIPPAIRGLDQLRLASIFAIMRRTDYE